MDDDHTSITLALPLMSKIGSPKPKVLYAISIDIYISYMNFFYWYVLYIYKICSIGVHLIWLTIRKVSNSSKVISSSSKVISTSHYCTSEKNEYK